MSDEVPQEKRSVPPPPPVEASRAALSVHALDLARDASLMIREVRMGVARAVQGTRLADDELDALRMLAVRVESGAGSIARLLLDMKSAT